jgi:tRNA-Thr(GGU) m(6)t(6)A37 methyltransferase TsaA
MESISYHPVGVLHTPFHDLQGMPIQPTGASSAAGTAEIFPEFAAGLKDLAGFSHVILLYHLHAVRRVDLTPTPFLDTQPRGVFATRSPARPNPIGLSIVRLVRVEDNVLHLEALDMLDGTPLLDVKPYVPEFDRPSGKVATGWLAQARGRVRSTKSDGRFSK